LKEEFMNVAALRKVDWVEGQESAARLLKHARETGEDVLYQLNRYTKRHPWRMVATALAAGVVLGAMASLNGNPFNGNHR
jgi:ElaB/YqjD/DUF883 family membrane-anchored ribosome-binding protein